MPGDTPTRYFDRQDSHVVARRRAAKTLLILAIVVWVGLIALISHGSVPKPVLAGVAFLGFILDLTRIAFFADD